MRKAFAIWLAATVVALGLWTPSYLAAREAYEKALVSYQKAERNYKADREIQKTVVDSWVKQMRAGTMIPDEAWDFMLGNYLAPAEAELAKCKSQLDLAQRNLQRTLMAGYAYLLLSAAYWIIVWGFHKRSDKTESIEDAPRAH